MMQCHCCTCILYDWRWNDFSSEAEKNRLAIVLLLIEINGVYLCFLPPFLCQKNKNTQINDCGNFCRIRIYINNEWIHKNIGKFMLLDAEISSFPFFSESLMRLAVCSTSSRSYDAVFILNIIVFIPGSNVKLDTRKYYYHFSANSRWIRVCHTFVLRIFNVPICPYIRYC